MCEKVYENIVSMSNIMVMNDVDKSNIFMVFMRNLKDIISISL